jgi:hypothetical protein
MHGGKVGEQTRERGSASVPSRGSSSASNRAGLSQWLLRSPLDHAPRWTVRCVYQVIVVELSNLRAFSACFGDERSWRGRRRVLRSCSLP